MLLIKISVWLAFVLILLGLFSFWWFVKGFQERIRLNRLAAKRITNWYVVNRVAGGELIDLEDLQDDIVYCKPGKAHKVTDELVSLLIKNKNPYFGPKVRDEIQVRVKAILFRMGEHVNESPGEYRARVEETIKSHKADRHRTWIKEKAGAYLRTQHGEGERSYEWDL